MLKNILLHFEYLQFVSSRTPIVKKEKKRKEYKMYNRRKRPSNWKNGKIYSREEAGSVSCPNVSLTAT